MNQFFKRPVVFHGLMAGAVLFAIKLALYFSGNWIFKLSPTYAFVSFTPVLVGMFLGSSGEAKLNDSFNYWRALLACLTVTIIAVTISLLAEQVIYRAIDPSLAAKTKDFMLKADFEAFKKIKFVTAKDKQFFLDQLEKSNPKEIYSIVNLIIAIPTYTFLNGIWGFLVANYTRKRKVEIL